MKWVLKEFTMSDDFEKKYKLWHGYWSFVKSAIRIAGCIGVFYAGWGIKEFALAMGVAEVVGIVEEWL